MAAVRLTGIFDRLIMSKRHSRNLSVSSLALCES